MQGDADADAESEGNGDIEGESESDGASLAECVAERAELFVADLQLESRVERVTVPDGDWLLLTLSDTVALSLTADAVASALPLLE